MAQIDGRLFDRTPFAAAHLLDVIDPAVGNLWATVTDPADLGGVSPVSTFLPWQFGRARRMSVGSPTHGQRATASAKVGVV